MLKIFLTNLGKYNEGSLVGEWVDLPVTSKDLIAVKNRIGINDDYEEWFITDFDSDIYGIEIHEFDDLDELNNMAETLKDMNEFDLDIIEALLTVGYSWEDALDKLDSCYVYSDCQSMEDVAREYCEQTGLLNFMPNDLVNYFDFDAFGRDMFLDGEFIFTQAGNCIEVRE